MSTQNPILSGYVLARSRMLLWLPLCMLATWLAIRFVHSPFVVIALVPMVAASQIIARGLRASEQRLRVPLEESARDENGLPLHSVAEMENLEGRRRAEASLAAEREMLRITLASIADAVITADPHGKITYVNDAALTLFGRSQAEMAHQNLHDVMTLTDTGTFAIVESLVDRCDTEMIPVTRTEPCALTRPDGSIRYVTEVVTPVLDGARQLTGFVMVVHDVTVNLKRTLDLSHRADHDPLTNLMNRQAFERDLQQAFRGSRMDGTPATLIAIDLDKFKSVNDSAGHAAGDAVLRHVAAVLQRSVRPTDCIARLGGDEFIVLLKNCDLARSQDVSMRLLQGLNPLRTPWKGTVQTIGASLGLAQCSAEFLEPEEWTRAADAVCYEAKRSGRGTLRSWQSIDVVGDRRNSANG
ncbi:MAG: diguanylate cyclase [Steroidobacteraceae bacterium]